ncbi:hypothetical protein FBU30_004961 [Linnemannia zychae]|nr:hypothetical protein FBU30_004961 [Linnemannia zychae]
MFHLGAVLSWQTINLFPIRGLGYISTVSGVIIAFAVALLSHSQVEANWVYVPFTTFLNYSGSSNAAFAALSSTLMASFVFCPQDTVIRMSEESRGPEKVLPRLIILSSLISLILGFPIVLGLNYGILHPIKGLLDEAVPAVDVILMTLGRPLGITFVTLILTAIFFTGLSRLAIASRVAYAFSRDGGLPKSSYWNHLQSRRKTPQRISWLVTAACMSVGAKPDVGSLALPKKEAELHIIEYPILQNTGVALQIRVLEAEARMMDKEESRARRHRCQTRDAWVGNVHPRHTHTYQRRCKHRHKCRLLHDNPNSQHQQHQRAPKSKTSTMATALNSVATMASSDEGRKRNTGRSGNRGGSMNTSTSSSRAKLPLNPMFTPTTHTLYDPLEAKADSERRGGKEASKNDPSPTSALDKLVLFRDSSEIPLRDIKTLASSSLSPSSSHHSPLHSKTNSSVEMDPDLLLRVMTSTTNTSSLPSSQTTSPSPSILLPKIPGLPEISIAPPTTVSSEGSLSRISYATSSDIHIGHEEAAHQSYERLESTTSSPWGETAASVGGTSTSASAQTQTRPFNATESIFPNFVSNQPNNSKNIGAGTMASLTPSKVTIENQIHQQHNSTSTPRRRPPSPYPPLKTDFYSTTEDNSSFYSTPQHTPTTATAQNKQSSYSSSSSPPPSPSPNTPHTNPLLSEILHDSQGILSPLQTSLSKSSRGVGETEKIIDIMDVDDTFDEHYNPIISSYQSSHDLFKHLPPLPSSSSTPSSAVAALAPAPTAIVSNSLQVRNPHKGGFAVVRPFAAMPPISLPSPPPPPPRRRYPAHTTTTTVDIAMATTTTATAASVQQPPLAAFMPRAQNTQFLPLSPVEDKMSTCYSFASTTSLIRDNIPSSLPPSPSSPTSGGQGPADIQVDPAKKEASIAQWAQEQAAIEGYRLEKQRRSRVRAQAKDEMRKTSPSNPNYVHIHNHHRHSNNEKDTLADASTEFDEARGHFRSSTFGLAENITSSSSAAPPKALEQDGKRKRATSQ